MGSSIALILGYLFFALLGVLSSGVIQVAISRAKIHL